MLKIMSVLSLCLVFQSAVQAQACGTLESLNWLLGNWNSANSKLKISESWQQTSAKTFEGSGYTYSIGKNKIVSTETLRLVEMSGEIFYMAKVASNDLPVAFKLTNCTANMAVFENAQHDFPKKLHYQITTAKNMTVVVSGANDKGFSIDFVKDNDS